MMLAVLALVLPAVGRADCPPARDVLDEQAALYDELRAAPNDLAAGPFVAQLWQLWTEAPDARAQDLLDAGMAARQSFDFDHAKAAFDELILYCPAYAEGWNQRAFVAFLREEYANALDDLEKALELNPDHVAALSGLGLTLMRLGRDEVSQSVLRHALKLNPWLPERVYVKGALPPGGTDL